MTGAPNSPYVRDAMEKLEAVTDQLEQTLYAEESRLREEGFNDPWLVTRADGTLLLAPVLIHVVSARTALLQGQLALAVST